MRPSSGDRQICENCRVVREAQQASRVTDMPENSATDYVKKTEQASDFIVEKIRVKSPEFRPAVALTLGSGLSGLEGLIKPLVKIPYAEIPFYPLSTVGGHKGELLAGYLEGVPLVGLSTVPEVIVATNRG